MTVTNAYCTEADVRAHLGDAGGKLDAALLDRAINAASRAIDRYTGRRFWQDADATARLYRANDRMVVYVDDISTSAGLALVTDIHLDGTWANTWDTDHYQLEPLNADANGQAYTWYRLVAVSHLQFPIDTHRATVKVTARWGWSEVPDEVNEACILKAVSLFRRKDAPFGIAGMGDFGPVRITRKDPDVLDLLGPYVLSAIS